MVSPEIRVRTWVAGTAEEVRTGLLGYMSVLIGPVVVDGLTLRKLLTGRLGISFPAKTKASGQRFSIVRPVDDAARRLIEREILGQLGQHQEPANTAEDQR